MESLCIGLYFNALSLIFRLLAYTYEEGLHIDSFKLPIACSCHVSLLACSFPCFRLLAYTYEEGLHIDSFKLPIACSCHVRKGEQEFIRSRIPLTAVKLHVHLDTTQLVLQAVLQACYVCR
jgi:hypothetical protein